MTGGMSLRDRAIVMGVVVLFLYALAATMWFLKFDQEWRVSAKHYDAALKTNKKEMALIARRGELQAKYDEEQAKIPMLAEEKAADTYWSRVIETMAEKNNIKVTPRPPGREEHKDVLNKYELTLDWEASLNSLVKFLYALETEQSAMFDVIQIDVKAQRGRKAGYLAGNMIVCCAYLRGEEEEGEEEKSEEEVPEEKETEKGKAK